MCSIDGRQCVPNVSPYNYGTVIYDNPCYFDESYDNPLFVPDIKMHGNKEVCLEKVYDKALDDGPILLDICRDSFLLT